jgi:hypothetical protein
LKDSFQQMEWIFLTINYYFLSQYFFDLEEIIFDICENNIISVEFAKVLR